MDYPMDYLKSVFSMINLTFSSVNSVILTLGWLAYGMVKAKNNCTNEDFNFHAILQNGGFLLAKAHGENI
jgi:hypothetical protein